MFLELEASIRFRAERKTERLYRTKEEAAGFQTSDRVRKDELGQSIEQALENIQKIVWIRLSD